MTIHTLQPLFADGALQFAFEKATTEGKATILVLFSLSMLSWTIIIRKFRQLYVARKWAKKFFAAYNTTHDPLDIHRKGQTFDGAPAYQLYIRGADELVERRIDVEGVDHVVAVAPGRREDEAAEGQRLANPCDVEPVPAPALAKMG